MEDTWVSDSGTFYALMVLDVNAFRDQVKGMNQLDEQVRQAIVERAEKSFDELERVARFRLRSQQTLAWLIRSVRDSAKGWRPAIAFRQSENW